MTVIRKRHFYRCWLILMTDLGLIAHICSRSNLMYLQNDVPLRRGWCAFTSGADVKARQVWCKGTWHADVPLHHESTERGFKHNELRHRAVIVIGGYPHFASQGDKTIGSLPSNLTRRFQRPDSALIRPKGWFGRMRAESAPYELRISSLTLPNPRTWKLCRRLRAPLNWIELDEASQISIGDLQ